MKARERALEHREYATDWETPWEVFEIIDEQFHFTLDVCASRVNAKVPRNFFDVETNGLAQSWAGQVCWLNPPYGQKNINAWMDKAQMETQQDPATVVVALLPASVETRWFRGHVLEPDRPWLIWPTRIPFVSADPKREANRPTGGSILVVVAARPLELQPIVGQPWLGHRR